MARSPVFLSHYAIALLEDLDCRIVRVSTALPILACVLTPRSSHYLTVPRDNCSPLPGVGFGRFSSHFPKTLGDRRCLSSCTLVFLAHLVDWQPEL